MKANALRAVGGLALVGLLAVLAAGCGGGASSNASANTDPSTATTPSTTTPSTGQGSTNRATAFAKYQSCLKAHGVDFPSFPRNGNGAPPQGTPPQGPTGQGGPPAGGFGGGLSSAQRAKFQAAQKACAKDLPAGARNGGSGFGGGNPQNSQAFAAYRNCLKLHGVKISQGFRPSTSGATSAKVRKALSACAALRPSFPGRGQAPPSTTTPGA